MPTTVDGKPFVCPHCKEAATIVEFESVTLERKYLRAGSNIRLKHTDTFYDHTEMPDRECSECNHILTRDELPNLD